MKKKLGLFEESDDDIKADYFSSDGKSNNNTEISNVKGRLASHLPFWKSIGTSDFILQVIEKGYALPFISEPKPAVFSNNRSARDNKEFVTSETIRAIFCKSHPTCHSRVFRISSYFNQLKVKVILEYGLNFSFKNISLNF